MVNIVLKWSVILDYLYWVPIYIAETKRDLDGFKYSLNITLNLKEINQKNQI